MKSERPTRVILDTDPGVDDALALILALHSPELEVVGVTTVCGNVPVERATRNLFRVLKLV
ncbi:nucleoside hydrolase, partial [Acidobacteriia bacterium AH_259_A11_L15]|nr:nucleoside hydrolase [Acidobacteriia bacterium AH_259_A11_L15]